MKVSNVNIFGFDESVRGAKFPMSVDTDIINSEITRGIDSLGRSEIGSGHDNFLNGIWRRGGLAGQTPEDAYEVHVGLGDTMTADDILEGYLRITVKVALIRPAEFIELTFQQLQQKS